MNRGHSTIFAARSGAEKPSGIINITMARNLFSSNTVDYALLGLFLDQSRHGYELYQLFQSLPGMQRVWVIKQPLFYAKLDRFEKIGLIETDNSIVQQTQPLRKYFRLTQAGKTTFNEWLSTPVLKARLMRQEFLVKLILVRHLKPATLPQLIEAQITAARSWVEGIESEAERTSPCDEDGFITTFRLHQIRAIYDWLVSIREKLAC